MMRLHWKNPKRGLSRGAAIIAPNFSAKNCFDRTHFEMTQMFIFFV